MVVTGKWPSILSCCFLIFSCLCCSHSWGYFKDRNLHQLIQLPEMSNTLCAASKCSCVDAKLSILSAVLNGPFTLLVWVSGHSVVLGARLLSRPPPAADRTSCGKSWGACSLLVPWCSSAWCWQCTALLFRGVLWRIFRPGSPNAYFKDLWFPDCFKFFLSVTRLSLLK